MRARRPSEPGRSSLLPGLLVVVAWASGVQAQGPGTAGAHVLTLPAGTRAAALAGAYTAVPDDPSGVFYNPASAAWLKRAVGFDYQEYVEDIVLGSVAGTLAIGPLSLAAGLVYLDAGEIAEIVPDPFYDGERGRLTGATVGATEAAGRFGAAIPLLHRRVSIAAAAGMFSSNLAGVTRGATFFDVGIQFRHRSLTMGTALRHLGVRQEDYSGELPLPLEVSLGISQGLRLGDRYGALLAGDFVRRIEERTNGASVGVEAGLLPGEVSLGAVLRVGVRMDEGAHLGRLRAGGGVGLRGLWLDYTVQSFQYLGTIHRFGVRWSATSPERQGP